MEQYWQSKSVDQDPLTIAGKVTSDSDSEHSSTTSAVPGSARAIEHYLRMVEEDYEASSESDLELLLMGTYLRE